MLTTDRWNTAPRRRHWPAAVVFDLDGALVNRLGDITSSIDTVVVTRGHPHFSEGAVDDFSEFNAACASLRVREP